MDFQYFPKWLLLAWTIVVLSGPSLQELLLLGIFCQIAWGSIVMYNGPTIQELLNLVLFCQIVWGSILLFWIFKHHCLQNQNPIHVGVGPSLSFQTWIKPEPSPFEPEPSFEPNINAFLASGPSSRRAELWFVISLNWWRSSISPVIEIVFLDWTELDSGQIQQDFSSWPWDNENQVLCKKARKISASIF